MVTADGCATSFRPAADLKALTVRVARSPPDRGRVAFCSRTEPPWAPPALPAGRPGRALVRSDPRTFFLPRRGTCAWVCAHLRPAGPRGDAGAGHRRGGCTPAMLHGLPEMEPPVAAAWNAMDSDQDLFGRPAVPRLHFVGSGQAAVEAGLFAASAPTRARDRRRRSRSRVRQIWRWCGSGGFSFVQCSATTGYRPSGAWSFGENSLTDPWVICGRGEGWVGGRRG